MYLFLNMLDDVSQRVDENAPYFPSTLVYPANTMSTKIEEITNGRAPNI